MSLSAHPTATGIVPARDGLDRAAGEAASGDALAESALACEMAGSRYQRYGALSGQLDRLARLADVGMALAEDLAPGRGAASAVARTVEDIERICLAFTRVARAIRQINAQEHVVLGFCETIGDQQHEYLAYMEEREERQSAAADRSQVVDTVRGLLDSRSDLSESERDDLMGDIARDYNDYRDLYRGSTDAIVRRICRDLGIREPAAGIAQPAKAAQIPTAPPERAGGDADLESLLHPTRRHGRDPP